MPEEMPGVRRSTGEQEAPEEQQEEFQVLQEAGEHPQGYQDTWAQPQGSAPAGTAGKEPGWIPSAGMAGTGSLGSTGRWEAPGWMELSWDG